MVGYKTKLDSNEEKLNAILPYIGQEYNSTTSSGILTLNTLQTYLNSNFNDEFTVILKSLDDITESDAYNVYKIALGGRTRFFETIDFLIESLAQNDDVDDSKEKLKEILESMPDFTLGEKQFHVRHAVGNFDFWHGHKSLKELHFGFETENQSSYAEYSCMNPHMIIQYLQRNGYMIPYNGVDLFDDGIATNRNVLLK